jgi:two-component system sensor histidine kinase KdpD
MRGNLLSSLSHDFRTPLKSILGASNAILEQKDMLVEMRDSLLKDIQENARWLIRIVENILTVTQISQESMKLHKRLESAEEVIAQSVSIIRGRFPNSMIHVRTPDKLIMVPMDSTLISQVVINLLENAIKHSDMDSFVLLSLRQKGHLALFEVSDHGAGIPASMLDNIFEIRTQPEDEVPVDAERGIGIGLNICRTIIQAHNGIIEANNRREGGARFSFWLPLDLDDNDTER